MGIKPGALRRPGAELDGGERALDRVGRAQVPPVLGGIVVQRVSGFRSCRASPAPGRTLAHSLHRRLIVDGDSPGACFAEQILGRRPEVPGRQAAQVQDRHQRRSLRRPPGVRWQDLRRTPLPLAGLLTDSLVVDPGRPHRNAPPADARRRRPRRRTGPGPPPTGKVRRPSVQARPQLLGICSSALTRRLS